MLTILSKERLFPVSTQPTDQSEKRFALPAFIVSRVLAPSSSNFEGDLASLSNSAQIERMDQATWKMWLQDEWARTDDFQTRVFGVSESGEWTKLPAISLYSPVYIHADSLRQGTNLTMLARTSKMVRFAEALLVRKYDSVTTPSLDKFRQRNPRLIVQSATVYDEEGGNEVSVDYGKQPKPLERLSADVHVKGSQLTSFSSQENVVQPPVRVRKFGIDLVSRELWFFVDSDRSFTPENEASIVHGLFSIADRVYRGQRITRKS